MEPDQVDIAIVGGGMVGLTLAIGLARAGADVALVERASIADMAEAAFDGRGSAIAAGSQRILDGVGLWRALQPDASPILEIRVADGARLGYEQKDIVFNGHAIECRINAENPFSLEPSPGKLWECHWPGGPGVRVDSHGFSGYVMPEAFDSLLAKVITWAPTRDQAIVRLDSALEETILLGVDTLIPLHRAILQESDFLEKKIHI